MCMLFDKSKTEKVESNKFDIRNLKSDYDLRTLELEKNHELELKEKEFELKHFKDEEVQKLRDSVAEKSQRIAVLEKENEMLDKIVDLNADIVDVKELVKTLISKLPNIDIKSINVTSSKESKE